MRVDVTINGGIGDLIHSKAMLDGHRHRYEEIAVGIDHQKVAEARSPEYLRFANLLLSTLFQEPPYTVARGKDGAGMTPQSLAAHGWPVLMPDLRGTLGESDESSPYIVVTTKIRGWPRFRYLEIRDEFLTILEAIALRMPVVLVGEREIGTNAEYEHHGEDLIYSIYDDLAGLTSIDMTVPELGHTPPTWPTFVEHCRVMQGAERVLTLGTGGNVSMAMAFGRTHVLACDTEMGGYFEKLPHCDRVRLHWNIDSYLEAARAIA